MHTKLIQNRTVQFAFCTVLTYCFILMCNGYTFGSGDQIEVIPFVHGFVPGADYSQDFFIRNYLTQGHNIRQGIIELSRFGMAFMPLQWWYFLLQIFFSLLLIGGLIKILSQFTEDKFIISVSICISLGILYGFTLGSNEVYYPSFIASLVANSLLMWSIFFYLKSKHWLWPIFILPALFFQELAALQIWILLSGATLISVIINKRNNQGPTFSIKSLLPIIILAAIIIFLKRDILSGRSGDLSEMLKIITWRTSHHFLPSEFGRFNFALFLITTVFTFYWMKRKWPEIRILMYLIIAGCIIYSLVYSFLPVILLSQWFKSTMWLKVIVIGYSVIFVNSFLQAKRVLFNKPIAKFWMVIILLILGIYKGPGTRARYEFPFFPITDNEKLIAIDAQTLTPRNSLFVIPADNSTFKIWSGRSCYIDYKSVVADDDVMIEWLHRITEVYGIGLKDPGGMHSYAQMEQYFEQFILDKNQLINLGITHILTKSNCPDYKLISRRGDWRIYQIKY